MSAEVINMIKDKDDIRTGQDYNMLSRFGITFNPLREISGGKHIEVLSEVPHDQGFNRKVKLLINSLLMEGRNNFEEFNRLMQEVFNPIPDTKRPDLKKKRVPLENTRVGMRFKNDMPKYTVEEIEDIGVPIKSLEVLRVLIKWIISLEEIVKEPEVHIIDSQDYATMGLDNIEMYMKTRYDR